MVDTTGNKENCGNVEECISILSERLKNGGLSIFCGAGISYNSGIMTVEPLVKYLLSFLSADQEDIDIYLKDSNGMFRLPIPFEAIIESLKENLQFEKEEKTFIEAFAQLFDGKPSVYHELFAHLLLSGKINFIVTTNFDTCLEQALRWKEGDSRVIIPYAETLESLKDINIIGKIIKLHGCKSRPEYLGATVDQITRTEYWQKTSMILDKIFYEGNCSSVLFMGYSCSDMWDVVEYFNNCALQNKKLVSCIYWQHSNEKNVLVDSNPQKMLGKHSSLFFGGDTDTLISKLFAIEKLEIKKTKSNYDCKTLESNIPVDTDYVLGKLYQDSHHYDLAIKSYEKALSKIGEANSTIRIETLRELSKIYESKNNFAKAESLIAKALELIYQLDVNEFYIYIFDVVTLYADLLTDTGKFESAKNLYIQNINEIAKITQGIPDRVVSPLGYLYNSLALVYKQLQDYDSTQKYFQKALDIFRECAKERPQKYLPDIAMVLSNWAILLNELNDYKKSEEFYKEALKIRRKLAEVNLTYLSDVATTLNNLGVSQIDRKDYVSSNKLLEEALQIRRNLAKFNASIYLPYVATTLENLADNYLYLKDYNRAGNLCLESIGIFRRFSNSDIGVYLAELANSLTDMANILCMDNKISEALSYCEEAIEIRKRLVESSKQGFLPDLVESYICLATIQQYSHADSDAEKTYENMLQLSNELIKSNRLRYIKQHAMILFNYANFKQKVNNLEFSKKLYNKSLAIFKELSKDYTSIYLPNVVDILKQICFVNEKMNDANKNTPLWKRIVKFDRLLSKDNPQKYLPQTALDLIKLADTQNEYEDILISKRTYEDALQILKSLQLRSSSEYTQNIIDILNKLGIINFELSEFDVAIELYKEALCYNDMYIDKYAKENFFNAAMSYLNMANSQSANDHFIESEISYKKSLDFYEKISKDDSEDYLYDLSVAQYNISELYARRYTNYKQAVFYMKNCIETRRKLADMNEDTYFPALTKALDLLGFIYFSNGSGNEAEICLSEILERCKELSDERPNKYLFELARYQTAIARFYQYNVIDKAKSMDLAMKAISNLKSYTSCNEINDALEEAKDVLNYWS